MLHSTRIAKTTCLVLVGNDLFGIVWYHGIVLDEHLFLLFGSWLPLWPAWVQQTSRDGMYLVVIRRHFKVEKAVQKRR